MKTIAIRRTDQIRTRNFKAQNERIVTGVLFKSHRKTSALRGNCEAISGGQLDTVQEETLVVSSTDPIVDRKHNRALLFEKRGTQTDGRKPSTGFGLRGESPSGKKVGERAKKSSKESVMETSCDHWHPPCQSLGSFCFVLCCCDEPPTASPPKRARVSTGTHPCDALIQAG